MPVNKRFFMDYMADRRLSLREVAKQMEVWPAALSRSLDGKRKMQLPEAVKLAQVLNIPIAEVLANAGIEAAKKAGRRCDIIGHLNGDGIIVPTPEGTVERIAIPDAVPDNVVAVQCRTSDTSLTFADGWVTFAGEQREPAELIGLFCVICLEDNTMRFGQLRRGYEPGTFNIFGWGYEPIKCVRVGWARKAILTIH